MSSRIKELTKARDEAEQRHSRTLAMKRDEIAQRMEAFRERTEFEAGLKHDPSIEAAADRAHAARVALDEALEARALTGEGAPYPLGTKLYEWERKKWAREWALTGRVGVMEGFTRQSEQPDSLQHGRARIGDYVVRVLKKDGTPSKLYINRFHWRNWLPEGIQHPDAKK